MKLGSLGLLSRGGFALADQILSSGTNFATAIVVARLLGPADYGSYVIAFGAWIVVMGFIRSMVINPYVVRASSLNRSEWIPETCTASGIALGAGFLGGIIIAGIGLSFGLGHPFGQPLFVIAFFIPPLALQEFWRFAAFSLAIPRMALWNDAVWTVIQAMAFLLIWLLIKITPAWMIVGWGAGALAGAIFGLWQFGAMPVFGQQTFAWLRENASFSGWLVLESLIYSAGSQLTTVLIAVVAGRAALGGIQSIVNLFGPAHLLSQASQSIGLPLASSARSEAGPDGVRHIALRYSLLVGLGLTAYTLLVLGAGPFLLNTVFGEAFAQYRTLLLPLALGFIFNYWGTGATIGLMSISAGGRLAGVQFLVTLTQLLMVSVLGLWFGILGVAWGLTCGTIVRFSGLWLMCLRATRPALVPVS